MMVVLGIYVRIDGWVEAGERWDTGTGSLSKSYLQRGETLGPGPVPLSLSLCSEQSILQLKPLNNLYPAAAEYPQEEYVADSVGEVEVEACAVIGDDCGPV